MPSPSIRLSGLKKSYGVAPVLDGIDLAVLPGQVVGYIGPNGAGKSTTIKILMGLLDDFHGEVEVCGLDVRTRTIEVKSLVGYVPESAQLYEVLSVREHLQLVSRLQGLPDELGAMRARTLMDAFGLGQRMDARLGTLSRGQRQKVMLAGSLLHDPEGLFLDEPLSGLDVASTILVKTLIRALADAGKTVFYSSHIMDVVERVCDRIVILSGGRIVADGSYEELSAQRQGGSLESLFAELTGTGGEEATVRRVLDVLAEDRS